ncbi:MAG: CBM9 family sugar-binding protein [Phycisphaerae bacterium]
MCKKLICLVSFVLVLAFAGITSAVNPDADIDIPSPEGDSPVIDGIIDDVWSLASTQYITILVSDSAPSSDADCSGSWRTLWDGDYLYVLVDVNDEALYNDTALANSWQDDSVEVYFDGNNSKGDSTDEDDYQFCVRWSTEASEVEQLREYFHSPDSLVGMKYAVVTTDDGYLFEIGLPWSTLIGGPPEGGQLIGMDVFINDDDNGGDSRETQLAWHAPEGIGWNTPSMWGTAWIVPGRKASGPKPTNGAIVEDTWANLGWTPGVTAVSHDVYISENYDAVNDGAPEAFVGNQVANFIVVGFPGFPYPDGLVPGTSYYWRIAEVEEDGTTIRGGVWSFTVPPKTAYEPNPADGAQSIATDVELSWTPGFGAKLHTVYFGDNFDDVDNAAGGLPQGVATYTPGTLKMAKTYYWRVDEFDAVETYKGSVWSFTTEGAVGSPDPANGAVDVEHTPILTWTPGVYADSHQVFFGADEDAVKNADTSSPEYKGSGNLGAESYETGKLLWNTTYYWRIDEANNVNPDSPWTGNIWSFTTANFLVVDDFESYNDIDPPDPESNRIFEAWSDGYEIPTNGALVGNELPPYAEQRIVHSGIQSMPYFYDNSVGNSEATHTLTYPRDWTENGVSTLSIWFRGVSDNAAESMYVALNGSAVVSHDNPTAAQMDTWTEWVLPLSAPGGFADQGVNLANVNTIGLGFGNRNNPVAGGSGTMYFDDIRLYPPPPGP